MREDLEGEMLKNRILSKNGTFKTAFKATLGFYAGQFVATLFGLLFFASLAAIAVLLYKLVTL